MNSSTGFKKRSLLRPPSGMREREREFLKSIDISQSETMILNQLKTEISRIQEEINVLDQDRKIRTGEGSSLQKSYILTLRKWLRENSFSTSEKEDDDFKVMKSLNVESYENGFKKLWRMLVGLDQIICKATELEIVQLLKYDDAFTSLTEDSEKANNILSTIGKTGFSPSTFQVSQVFLERNKDLFSLLLEGKHQTSGKEKRSSLLTEGSSKDLSKKQETNDLIEQLRKENEKLNSLLEELDREKDNNRKLKKELEIKEQIIAEKEKSSGQSVEITATNTNPSSVPSNSGLSFSQLEEKYNERLAYLSQQIFKLESLVTEQKVMISTLEKRAKMAEDELKETDKTKSFRPKEGSYEEALVEEMDKMKKGFEKKIKTLLEDHGQKEKEMRAKEIEYRTENDKIKWEKGLLLKKFETMESSQKLIK